MVDDREPEITKADILIGQIRTIRNEALINRKYNIADLCDYILEPFATKSIFGDKPKHPNKIPALMTFFTTLCIRNPGLHMELNEVVTKQLIMLMDYKDEEAKNSKKSKESNKDK